MLTVEIKNIDLPKETEVEIYCDKKGLKTLLRELQHLQKGAAHVHLLTPSWAGVELTEEKQGEKTTLINHLKVYFKHDTIKKHQNRDVSNE